ncbi:bromodomain-containing protein 4-like [Canis lupus dingo]|uniref:bromodomain-containing protein 4-like n=1 Tax=Canis lupus dingo TaxID=286419 RepID=UPI0020C2B755|nr:bromodomain-containing protein 4-like [Canis lupus dingo]
MWEGACLPFLPGVGTGPSLGTLGLQGEGLSADWTPPAHSDDAGPHSGRNCGAPGFHRCLVPTLRPQTIGGTCAPDLARSDPTLLLSPVAQYSSLLSTPTLPLSPVSQYSHSPQYPHPPLSPVSPLSPSPQYPHPPTLPSTPTLPLSPVPQPSHSPQYPHPPTLPSTPVHKEEALTQRQVTAHRDTRWPAHPPPSLRRPRAGRCHPRASGSHAPSFLDVFGLQHDAGGPGGPAGLAKGQYRGPVPSGAPSRVSAGPVTVQGHRPPGLSAGQGAARPQPPRGQETPPGDPARGQMDKNAQAMGPLPPQREAVTPGLQGGPAPGAGTGVAAIAERRPG